MQYTRIDPQLKDMTRLDMLQVCVLNIAVGVFNLFEMLI